MPNKLKIVSPLQSFSMRRRWQQVNDKILIFKFTNGYVASTYCRYFPSDFRHAERPNALVLIHVSFHMNKFHMSVARGLILAPQ